MGRGSAKKSAWAGKTIEGLGLSERGKKPGLSLLFPSASSNWADEKLLRFWAGPQTLLNSKYRQNSRSISYFVTYVYLGDGQKTGFGKAMKKVRGAESWKRSLNARSCRTLFLDLIPCLSAPPPSPLPTPQKGYKRTPDTVQVTFRGEISLWRHRCTTDAPQMTRRMSKSKKQFPEMTFVYFLAHNCEWVSCPSRAKSRAVLYYRWESGFEKRLYACTSVPRDAGKVNYLAILSDFLLQLVWLLAMKFPQKIKKKKARRR